MKTQELLKLLKKIIVLFCEMEADMIYGTVTLLANSFLFHAIKQKFQLAH